MKYEGNVHRLDKNKIPGRHDQLETQYRCPRASYSHRYQLRVTARREDNGMGKGRIRMKDDWVRDGNHIDRHRNRLTSVYSEHSRGDGT